MKCMNRDKKTFWYALYSSKEELFDSDGYATGSEKIIYSTPVKAKAVISPARGSAQIELFGPDLQYDLVILTDDTSCPIDEHSVLFVESEPKTNSDGDYIYDYIVRRVAKSANFISIAISRVTVA